MSAEQAAAAEEYGAGAIQVLEGLEAVRKRPGMYIGSTGPRGLHHLVYENVDNSVDEALAGHGDEIGIELHADGSVTVSDRGRGVPVDVEDTGVPMTQADYIWDWSVPYDQWKTFSAL